MSVSAPAQTTTDHSPAVPARIKWADVVPHAARIVRGYDTPVTLRQLFYQLVSDQTLPNTRAAYSRLSELTAEARREGTFPDFVDRQRSIDTPYFEHSAKEAVLRTVRSFRLDRTRTQPHNVLLAVEKDGLVTQLTTWFRARGLPVTALQGYCSQSHVDKVRQWVRRDGRPAVLLYAGDFDPSGEDIVRDFIKRTGCWEHAVRIGLTAEMVERFDLPPGLGKSTDPRASAFIARHGRLVQVELDALSPPQLRQLYEDALTEFWDTSAYQAVLAEEAEQQATLTEFAEGWVA